MKIKLSAIFLCFLIFSACKSSDNLNVNSSFLEYRGADISYFKQLEENNVQFYKNGKIESLFEILKDAGVNWIRLRLWHSPSDSTNNLENTLSVAKRVKDFGFKFLLDIHYSDSWADPSSQTIPSEWESYDFEKLKNAVSSYTKDVLLSFSNAGCVPDMVQTGNEIANGMLWPYGKIKEIGRASCRERV